MATPAKSDAILNEERPFQVGDRVRIHYTDFQRAMIVELRGPLGPGGLRSIAFAFDENRGRCTSKSWRSRWIWSNRRRPNELACGSDDGQILIWDVD